MTDHAQLRIAVSAFNEILGCGDLDAAKQIAAATLRALREKKLPHRIDVGDEEETHG